MAITPFKVTNFGTNRKPICDFLLVINRNLPTILHHSKLWPIVVKFLLVTGVPHFNTLARGDSLQISG